MGLKSRTPPRPPIPEFIVRAAAAEGVSPEELEDRMIEDMARLLRPAAQPADD